MHKYDKCICIREYANKYRSYNYIWIPTGTIVQKFEVHLESYVYIYLCARVYSDDALQNPNPFWRDYRMRDGRYQCCCRGKICIINIFIALTSLQQLGWWMCSLVTNEAFYVELPICVGLFWAPTNATDASSKMGIDAKVVALWQLWQRRVYIFNHIAMVVEWMEVAIMYTQYIHLNTQNYYVYVMHQMYSYVHCALQYRDIHNIPTYIHCITISFSACFGVPCNFSDCDRLSGILAMRQIQFIDLFLF